MSVSPSSRRHFLGGAAALGLVGVANRVLAEDPAAVPPPPATAAPEAAPPPAAAADAAPPEELLPVEPPPEPTSVTLPLAGGPKERPLTKDFPQKGRMILQSTRPPALETEFEVFDKDVITPNSRFYVNWHPANIPTVIDTAAFRLAVHGNVARSLSLSLADLKGFPKTQLIAVDQDAGNSRGLFQPRVAGTQWGHGAMGNARWAGVRLRDILARAGIGPGTVQVRFSGLDRPTAAGIPAYRRSLDLTQASSDEVIVAYEMNGEALPVLNGFPLRLVVPGWYGDYWVKMLNDIELLTAADSGYWVTSLGSVGRMVPRAFITNIKDGETLTPDSPAVVRGIAMGGDNGVTRVEFSKDGGKSWVTAKLGKDYGKYSFRQWQTQFKPVAGNATLLVRCTNTAGVIQSDVPNWNLAGLARNAVEAVQIRVGEDATE